MAKEIDWGKEKGGAREVHEAGTYKVECIIGF